eukprot:489744-Pleurochrysis_carterae.AAC.1
MSLASRVKHGCGSDPAECAVGITPLHPTSKCNKLFVLTPKGREEYEESYKRVTHAVRHNPGR